MYIKVINKYIKRFGGSVNSWNHSTVFTDVLYFITNVRTWKKDISSFIPDAYKVLNNAVNSGNISFKCPCDN